MDRLKLPVKKGHQFTWVIGEDFYDCVIVGRCPKCRAMAMVLLPPPLLAEQPDDTTHVCHPSFGGCNHGFAVTP